MSNFYKVCVFWSFLAEDVVRKIGTFAYLHGQDSSELKGMELT
jgi:hypothetical protein